MGTDLFTSNRGAGVIGTLLALIVLGGFSLLYFFVFDERLQGGGQTLESVIEEDADHLAKLREQWQGQLGELKKTEGFKLVADELRSQTTRRDITAGKRGRLEEDVAAAGAELAGAGEAFAKYRQAYRESARATMVGREMDELRTTDGRTYTQVKITEIDPIRMQIRHSGGITGVPLDTLPEDLQTYLQLDENEKEQRIAAEAAQRERQSASADQSDALQRIVAMQRQLAKLKEDRERASQLATRARDALPRLEQAILTKKSELAREEMKARTGGISNAPQVRVQLQKLEEQLQQARAQEPGVRAKVGELDKEIAGLEADIRAAQAELDRKQSDGPKP